MKKVIVFLMLMTVVPCFAEEVTTSYNVQGTWEITVRYIATHSYIGTITYIITQEGDSNLFIINRDVSGYTPSFGMILGHLVEIYFFNQGINFYSGIISSDSNMSGLAINIFEPAPRSIYLWYAVKVSDKIKSEDE